MNIAYDQDYIRVVRGVLAPKLCDNLIALFELNQPWAYTRTDTAHLTELQLITNYHISQMSPMERVQQVPAQRTNFTEYVELLKQITQSLAEPYLNTWSHQAGWIKGYNTEGYRIKRYQPNGVDSFDHHVDVSCPEHSTRFVSFLFYLNTSDGGTEFTRHDYTSTAEQGSVVIFPPLWPWPHRGHKTTTGPKYILSTYLHFI